MVDFNRFWQNSRYRQYEGLELEDYVRKAFVKMNCAGGNSFARFLECTRDGEVVGTMAIFKDADYRSNKRDDVGCFGLVTVTSYLELEEMLEFAKATFNSRDIPTFRGPINIPRYLFGYGVQVSGFDHPRVAGSSIDPPDYAGYYEVLYNTEFLEKMDKYHNIYQHHEITREFIKKVEFDGTVKVVNPDFENLGDMPERVADMLNRNLGYRPDYTLSSARGLRDTVEMFAMVPNGEKFLAFFFDGDDLVGGTLMIPDWFQLLRGEKVTNVIGDIYIIDKKYQGKRLMYNIFKYELETLPVISEYFEHSSIWEGTKSMMSFVSDGPHKVAEIIKTYHVYEINVGDD